MSPSPTHKREIENNSMSSHKTTCDNTDRRLEHSGWGRVTPYDENRAVDLTAERSLR